VIGLSTFLGGPAACAAFGGNLSLPWLPRTVTPCECRGTADRRRQGGQDPAKEPPDRGTIDPVGSGV